MIQIIECQKPGYPARTEENIIKSDMTIAIAVDFNSAGEQLTKRLCSKHKKLYIPVQFENMLGPLLRIGIIRKLDTLGINGIHINIAGNGIYTLKSFTEQDRLNEYLGQFWKGLLEHINIKHVRSGGQTGIDEAGIIGADFRAIPTTVLAPKGYMFRDINHKDIANKELFEKRFK